MVLFRTEMYTLRSNIIKPLQSLLHIFFIVLIVMEKVQTVKKKKKMHGIYTLNTDCSQKAILRTEVSVFFHSAVSFMQSTVPAHGLFMM